MSNRVRRVTPWLQAMAAIGGIASVAYIAVTKAPDDWFRWVIAFAVILAVAVVIIIILVSKNFSIKKEIFRTFGNLRKQNEQSTQERSQIELLSQKIIYLESVIDAKNKSEHACLNILKLILARYFKFCEFMHWQREDITRGSVEIESQSYIKDTLGLIAKLFTVYSGFHCSACVKYFSIEMDEEEGVDGSTVFRLTGEQPGPENITTLCRDVGSEQREFQVRDIEEPYSYERNTAFRDIVQHRVRFEGFFFGNELVSDPNYRNGNANWSEHYDSTAVCALQDPARLKLSNMIGFICVDNKGGGFDDESCRAILECCSSVLYYSLQTVLSVYYPKVVIEGD